MDFIRVGKIRKNCTCVDEDCFLVPDEPSLCESATGLIIFFYIFHIFFFEILNNFLNLKIFCQQKITYFFTIFFFRYFLRCSVFYTFLLLSKNIFDIVSTSFLEFFFVQYFFDIFSRVFSIYLITNLWDNPEVNA